MEIHIGRIGLGSRFLGELSPLPPSLYFTSCMEFFLEIQMLTLDSPGGGVMYVGLSQSQIVITVA